MRVLLVLAAVALAAANVVKDDTNVFIGKDNMVNFDIKMKELCIMKLLNHILQPTIYDDVREVAREWVIEDNVDKYLKAEVVRDFINTFRMGMLPRGEVFVHTNELHIIQAVKVFKILYFAKDFDIFMRTACWLRERINGGMFVYALTACVFHRADCRGITLPAPYEIYPYFFVDSHVINKAFMMKMTKAANDPVLMNYYGIKVTDKNLVVIDWRKGVRRTLSQNDRISYFTEDIDLNTYLYYLHMSYPYWMNHDMYAVNKERRGEIMSYATMQLLARLRLERLSHEMCDIKPIMWNEPLKTGYWPKIRLHTGDEMPVRSNNMILVTKENLKWKRMLDDVERKLRDGILNGKIERRDGTVISLKKPEDIEYLARMVLGGMGLVSDDAKFMHMMHLMKRLLSYNVYNFDKYTYVPTALDMYTTCLRDPVFWRLMKRVTDVFVLFKKMLPKYTRDDFDFPGVKIDRFTTDKLVTFMDEYDLDITNALYLDDAEMKKKRPDMLMVARMRRLNHHPFKVTVDVTSDKTVDAVVRIFIGPKYDCLGRLMSVNDKRLDMVEIDTFKYKLETGKNTIVRNSVEMHGVIEQRPWTRRILNNMRDTVGMISKTVDVESWWYKTRVGYPHRLLLPLGRLGGFPLQMYVIISPVKTNLLLPTVDMSLMKERRTCRWSVCFDTMPLGFPFDRKIDMTKFFTHNMKFTDVMVYRKDLGLSNNIKDVDMSDMVMKKDDYTYLDTDMLTRWSYKDVMMMSKDDMMRM
ncbi:basic juvenile hormone-suppressible protein 1-like [Spodoptera litura]|uniref:Basic juvenile hormone-suppressible protein 1-like n=1 Tax=Spodoptera litura TaxID=69820 RepID=A0A9J7ECP6_SPOLT|nr:basic juvenile hormone-suppressible protein 1-like [Spodoptera litura]